MGEDYFDSVVHTIVSAVMGVDMPSANAFPAQRTYTFLNDPEDASKKSNIFLSFSPSDELQTWQELMEYLRTVAQTPLLLRRLARGRGTSVEIQAISGPKIVFGYSPPTTNPDADAAEIAKFIQQNKIPAVLS